jgi:hypothetical protein
LHLLVRYFADFAAIRVEAISHKDLFVRVRGVDDKVAHLPGLPVNAGYFITGHDRRPQPVSAKRFSDA